MTWRLIFAATKLAAELAGRLTLRPDMQADFDNIPPGPKWVLMDGERVIGLGGFEPAGAARSTGWLLCGEMTRREWAMARRAMREGLTWARSHGIKQVFALVAGDRPDHAAMLARLGFSLSGQEGDDAVMKKELG
jgi:hypothetical protein